MRKLFFDKNTKKYFNHKYTSYYIKRDDKDTNLFFKITENYDFNENLLIQDINKFSKTDVDYVRKNYTLFHES